MSTPDPAEFTQHWMQSRHVVAAFVHSMVHDEHQAEDVLQQVAIAAATNFDQYDRERPFTYWLIGIAKRRVAQHFREAKRDRHRFDHELLDQMVDAYVEVADELPARNLALQKCIKKLNERGQDILEMRYQQNLRPKQIAARVGVSPTAITSLLHRIRLALSDCVERQLKQMEVE